MATLPQSLDAFHKRILLEIGEQDVKWARLALQWIAYAARPISVEELAEALIVQPKSPPYVDASDRFISSSDILEILPTGLVTTYREGDDVVFDGRHSAVFDKDDISMEAKEHRSEDIEERYARLEDAMIRFAHISVKDYLTSEQLVDTKASGYGIDEISAHSAISEVCLAYLFYIGAENPEMSPESYKDFALLDYAALCWPVHLKAIQGYKNSAILDELSRLFLNITSKAWETWLHWGYDDGVFQYFSYRWREHVRNKKKREWTSPSPIHPILCASQVGLADQIPSLVADQIEPKDTLGSHDLISEALFSAIRNGHAQVVEILMAAGADIIRRYLGQTALEAGANPSGVDFEGISILETAVANGSTDIVRLLLEKGAEVEVHERSRTIFPGWVISPRGSAFVNALQSAAYRENLEIVQLLLQKGADVNAPGGDYGSALQVAASTGNLDIVSLLLQTGADVGSLRRSLWQCSICSSLSPIHGRSSQTIGSWSGC